MYLFRSSGSLVPLRIQVLWMKKKINAGLAYRDSRLTRLELN